MPSARRRIRDALRLPAAVGDDGLEPANDPHSRQRGSIWEVASRTRAPPSAAERRSPSARRTSTSSNRKSRC